MRLSEQSPPLRTRSGRRRPLPTIYQVARQAGVSIATVSRVYSNEAVVAEETRLRVLEAIADLGYQPSRLGRSLAEGRHGASGIVFPDLTGPYYSEVILGYEDQAATGGRSVLILGTHGREHADELVRGLAGRVDGMVIMGRTVSDEVVEALDEDGLPIVLLARPPAGEADSVRTENVQAAAQLTSHVIGHGHRRLAFIGDPDSSPDAGERWAGFRAALMRAGLSAPRSAVRSSFREHDGYAAAASLLDGGSRPTAIVCANDEIALGAYGACQERSLRIPEDVAVTGWDDIAIARYISPTLTTVRQPLRELGALAARLLEERSQDRGAKPRHEVLPTELVIRASCGCERTAEPRHEGRTGPPRDP
ncbi:MAG: LacI family transcriptional regulator [Chloroflexota bacterium]|nr:LacI family transcriptional regulator [Chloroflexota bacterium]